MTNREREGISAEQEQPVRKTLIHNEFSKKEVSASFHEFAKQTGRADIDITSPQGNLMHREWLLQQTDSSPELNFETMVAVKDLQEELLLTLREGDKEATLTLLSQLKVLIDKLERGITKIE